eukprot:scaffold28168_cov75-Phaeocystis_antarctica.AAC.1
MLKVSPWQRRSSAPVPPHGTSGRSGWLGEAGPLGAQPLPRVLELAAPKAADSPAFDHSGAGHLRRHGRVRAARPRRAARRGRGRGRGGARRADRRGRRRRRVTRRAARVAAWLEVWRAGALFSCPCVCVSCVCLRVIGQSDDCFWCTALPLSERLCPGCFSIPPANLALARGLATRAQTETSLHVTCVRAPPRRLRHSPACTPRSLRRAAGLRHCSGRMPALTMPGASCVRPAATAHVALLDHRGGTDGGRLREPS